MCGFDGKLGRNPVAIQAAHVHWHSRGGPDDLADALALCALHHVLFDLGVVGITPDRRITVARDYVATTSAGRTVDHLAGRPIGDVRPGQPANPRSTSSTSTGTRSRSSKAAITPRSRCLPNLRARTARSVSSGRLRHDPVPNAGKDVMWFPSAKVRSYPLRSVSYQRSLSGEKDVREDASYVRVCLCQRVSRILIVGKLFPILIASRNGLIRKRSAGSVSSGRRSMIFGREVVLS